MTKTQTPYQFFLKHAGYSHAQNETAIQGQRRCARQLAKDEAEALALGVQFDWQDDERAFCYYDEPTCEYHEGSDHDWPTLFCVAFNDCYCSNAAHEPHRNILASLCGIMDPDANYRRVVEAELALEALETLKA
jgi:hypothetical protein